jgi:formylglycine-generating enzyme required for sulfatase activity
MPKENFYILLELSPAENDTSRINAAIKKKQVEWSKQRNHPTKGRRAQRYLGLIPENKKVMADPRLAQAEAKAAQALLDKRLVKKPPLQLVWGGVGLLAIVFLVLVTWLVSPSKDAVKDLEKPEAALEQQQERLRQQQAELENMRAQLPVNSPRDAEKVSSLLGTGGKVFRDRLKDGSLGPEMVWIAAGSFKMGDIQGGGGSDEKPVHDVSVGRFAMGQYEVTFAEYDRFAEATGRKKPSDRGWGRGNRPVIYVSWYEATAYTRWIAAQTGQKYRLPTEAEWEYAARAGTTTKYWWGNEIGSNKANCWNNDCGDHFKNTAPVGSFAPNSFGLHDTVGNVWEWTCSEYENRYNGKETVCKKEAIIKSSVVKSNLFVLRSGSWGEEAGWSRSAFRFWGQPTERFMYVGFRLARLP